MPTYGQERVRQRLDRALNGILIGIAVEFFLGMWLNLFGTFPAGNSNVGATLTFGADPVLIAHVVLAILLVLGSIAIVLLSFRDTFRPLRWYAVGGLLSFLFAAFAGSGFVYSGYSSGLDSFLMAVGFAGALTSYYEGLVRLRGNPLPTTIGSAA